MKILNLGTQGIKASEMGLGCMGMSEFYGEGDNKESINTIHRAIDLGVTFFDTADVYGPYKNEELLGQAIKGKRDALTIATKFGIVRNPDRPRERGINGKPQYVKKACLDSIRRLNINVIDLYYLHRVDPDTPIEETVQAMAGLVKDGLVRGIGLSEVSASTLRKAHAIHPITAVQSEYSLWSREPEEDVLDTCRELGIAFVAYSPLGRGFLTGRFKSPDDFDESDYRRRSPRFQGENFQKNLDLVKKIEELAKHINCTPAQLALAWVMAREEFIFPIPGTKQIRYLEENIEALTIGLTENQMQELDKIAPKDVAAGTRYPSNMMGAVNR